MENQMEINSLVNPKKPSTSCIQIGNNSMDTNKTPFKCLKKPREALGSSLHTSSKKQKLPGASSDQCTKQFNDVLTVSGVTIREEEQSFFSGPKEEICVSEASGLFLQKEDKMLILEKIPLRHKLEKILGKYSLKGFSNDVEHCLSMCVEQRMLELIVNIIRLSNQRFDIEKPRHETIVTSDVRQKIVLINQNASEAKAKKFPNQNGAGGFPRPDGEKEMNEGLLRLAKADRGGDDRMQLKAANAAIRAALGDHAMLSSWRPKTLQSRQKCGGEINVAPGSQPRKNMGESLSQPRSSRDNQEAGKSGHSAAKSTPVVEAGRNKISSSQSNKARTVSVKDVIAVLERESQTSKSSLLYRWYEKENIGVAEIPFVHL